MIQPGEATLANAVGTGKKCLVPGDSAESLPGTLQTKEETVAGFKGYFVRFVFRSMRQSCMRMKIEHACGLRRESHKRVDEGTSASNGAFYPDLIIIA